MAVFQRQASKAPRDVGLRAFDHVWVRLAHGDEVWSCSELLSGNWDDNKLALLMYYSITARYCLSIVQKHHRVYVPLCFTDKHYVFACERSSRMQCLKSRFLPLIATSRVGFHNAWVTIGRGHPSTARVCLVLRVYNDIKLPYTITV